MTPPDASPDDASVVIVSRHRAASLARCLVALSQQDHPRFEVIVVADPEGLAAAQATGLGLKLVGFDQPNISAARNLGLAQAAAPLVAFIDDDAVAEATWLSRLVRPFHLPDVVASTGFVRGRNGISYQWRAASVDARGQDHPLEVPEEGAVLPSRPGFAVKTVGTNCAFRAAALRAVGGFDPAYRFYLDEADVNLRLGPQGLTAIVPLAQVHHGFEASPRRRADRVPTDLQEIAASTAVFLRRHAPEALGGGLALLREQQKARLDRHRKAGRLTVAEVTALLKGLEQGWADGESRALREFAPLRAVTPDLKPLADTGPRPGLVLAGRIWSRRRLLREAKLKAPQAIVTVYSLSPTPRRHSVRFDPHGFWLHQGGLFGQVLRAGPRLRLLGFGARIRLECRYWAKFRPMDAEPCREGKFIGDET
ncbi:glycosyltransferase family 2 protein [Fuscibacter oryzae]|uniref:Glycosyltransferase n=1 Tax=Fuscibacter oryzae TaxID=2803939 RepID=A0A8J7SX77_9RHOB|nr:glycosyltransferase [Fuscibacter oryzae]MBL4929679.1 glycosyltransferase [Fuscibacter oryzae]